MQKVDAFMQDSYIICSQSYFTSCKLLSFTMKFIPIFSFSHIPASIIGSPYFFTYNITYLQMQSFMMPLQFVQESISRGFSHATCQDIHGSTCNAFCLNYVLRVAGNTYKTYGAVYLVQLLFKLKKIAKNPPKEIFKFLFDYVKSTSLTAVQMMIMRRILCFLCKYHRNGQNNLIAANFLSAFYILVESYTRQIQIALYQLNNTSLILYKMARRRGYVGSMKMGECVLFGSAIMIISHHFFNSQDAFRKNYIRSIFDKLIGDA